MELTLDIKQFRNKIQTSPFAVVDALIIVPPVGIAMMWSDNTTFSRKSKYILTSVSSFLWVLMAALCIAQAAASGLFRSGRNNDIVILNNYHNSDSDSDGTLTSFTDTQCESTSAYSESTTEKESETAGQTTAPLRSEDTSNVRTDRHTEGTPSGTEQRYENGGEDYKPVTDTEPVYIPPETTVPATSREETDAPVVENPNGEILITDCTYTVHRNKKASITIKGEPNTEYVCKVKYQSGYSSAKGTGVAVTDSNGYATWTWRIGAQTSTTFKPVITITGNGQTVTTEITILE